MLMGLFPARVATQNLLHGVANLLDSNMEIVVVLFNNDGPDFVAKLKDRLASKMRPTPIGLRSIFGDPDFESKFSLVLKFCDRFRNFSVDEML